MLGNGAIRTLARFCNNQSQPREVVLANRQLQTEPRQFALRVLVVVRCADYVTLGFVMFGSRCL